VREGWVIKELGDVCRVVGGGTPPKDREDFYKGSIPWATVRDMRQDIISDTEFKITELAVKSSSTNVIPANSVVIATRVGLGKICFVERDTAINQDLRGILPIRPKELSAHFLFWWFKSVAHLIEQEGTGATVQGVKLPFIKSLQVPLPPLREQKRIIAILDEAFQGIDAAIANAERNLANVRELFEVRLQRVSGGLEPLGDLVEIRTGKLDANAAVEGGRYPFFTCAKEVYAIDTFSFLITHFPQSRNT
jgi:type I restriction enzyme S subunit